MTQVEAVYSYMKQHGSIEPLQALRDLGVFRLAARINDLRNKGYEIKTDQISIVCKITGNKVKFARYSLANREG